MTLEQFTDKALTEVDVLATELMIYTTAEVELLKATISEQAQGNTNTKISDFVDMCTLLARI